jgi:hypothetical protein
MADESYAPWPEAELRALMGYHTQAARGWKEGSKMHADHTRRAKACDDAIRAHDALRDRFHAVRLQLSQWEAPS